MQHNINEVRLSGTIRKIKSVSTFNDYPKTEIWLFINSDDVRTIATGGLAITALNSLILGERIEIEGRLIGAMSSAQSGDNSKELEVRISEIKNSTGSCL